MEEKKLKSLLKFYKKKDVEVELMSKIRGGLIVQGKIIKLNKFFRKHIVVKSKEGIPIKIFLDDIIYDSIVPAEFAKEMAKEKKDDKKKKRRSPLPPKLRFEVLKRDKFVCQYCGACGSDLELEVDHVIPVSRGGKDDIKNLKTICWDCNKGKGDTVL